MAPRNALVIAVDKLKEGSGFQSLNNPRNDAKQVTDALQKSNFQVVDLTETYTSEDMTRQNIKKALYDFAILLKNVGGVGLIYYSGHGMERNGKIHLFPYDSFVKFDRDFDEELIPISLFYDTFKYADNPLNILIIDACHDDPWRQSPPMLFGVSTAAQATNNDESRVIVANSTLSGSKALDGTGDLSPYARAFAKALRARDLGLYQFFASIGADLILQPDSRLAKQNAMPSPLASWPF